MIVLLAAPALAVDGRWLGPGAEAPGTELEATAGVNVAVYGTSPLLGARAAWSPVRPVTLGASALWIGPTATAWTAGARALVLDHQHLRLATFARGAMATRFDGGLALLLSGAGLAAETQLGPLRASLSLPVAGLDQTGPLWLPGLWDTLATASVRWRAWQLALTSNVATNGLTLSWLPL
jgi:hypothetical protein